MILKFIIELLAICALLYGYYREEDIARWEDKQKARLRALWAERGRGSCQLK